VVLKAMLKRAAQAAGYEIQRMPNGERRWSDSVSDYYPVRPKPRWGHGRPAHVQLQARLEQGRTDYERVLKSLEAQRTVLHGIPHDRDPERPTAPFWNNAWFSVLDAASLVGFLLSLRPRRYLEIGSGHSTLFARHAIQVGALPTTVTSIDPHPRAEIDSLCDRVVRQSLEDCDLTLFDQLEPGDLLFFDGSHRVFTNSDVTAFFFDILPRIRPGVLVHVHDIFLPDDYPPDWNDRLYSEQYLLGGMLLCGAPPFRVVLPNYFVCTDDALSARVRAIFRVEGGALDIPFTYPKAAHVPGVSFWIEMAAVDRL
jgi:hypothetical protein